MIYAIEPQFAYSSTPGRQRLPRSLSRANPVLRFDGNDEQENESAVELSDRRFIEYVLSRSESGQDFSAVAGALFERFGSFAEFVAADPERLMEIEGVSAAAVREIGILRMILMRAAEPILGKRVRLRPGPDLLRYLQLSMAFEQREQVRLLFLNRRDCLIANEIHAEGTINHAPFYVREVIKRALELSAAGLILAHNHPSGDPTPSQEDIDLSVEIASVGMRLGIRLHDHIILGREGHISMKLAGIL